MSKPTKKEFIKSRPKNSTQAIIEIQEILESHPAAKICSRIWGIYCATLIGSYSHPDQEVENMVKKWLGRMRGGVEGLTLKASRAFWYGFYIGEIKWDSSESEWWVRDILSLDPAKVKPVLEDDVVKKISYQGVQVPIEKVFHLMNNEESYDNFYGTSSVMPLLSLFQQYDYLITDMYSAISIFGSPTVAYFGSNMSSIMEGGETKMKIITDKLEDIKSQSYIVGDQGDSVNFIENRGKFIDDFLSVKESINKDVYSLFAVPSLLIREPTTGSQGLAETQLEFFISMLISSVSYIAKNIIEQIVKPMIDYNIGQREEYGNFNIDRQEYINKETQAQIFKTVIDSAVLDLEDEEVIKKARGFL